MQPWIKMRTDLDMCHEVQQLADLLNVPVPHAIGLLWTFWRYVENSTPDGVLRKGHWQLVDRVCQHDGFAEALTEVGWLQASEGGLLVPNFDRHMGAHARKRAQTAMRVKNSRKRNAASVTKALPEVEEEVDTPKGVSSVSDDDVEKVYQAYPSARRAARKQSHKAIRSAITDIAKQRGLSPLEAAEWLLGRVKIFEQSPAGNRGKFTKLCASWMNAGCYDDDPQTWNLKDEQRDHRTDKAGREFDESDLTVPVINGRSLRTGT